MHDVCCFTCSLPSKYVMYIVMFACVSCVPAQVSIELSLISTSCAETLANTVRLLGSKILQLRAL